MVRWGDVWCCFGKVKVMWCGVEKGFVMEKWRDVSQSFDFSSEGKVTRCVAV